MKTSSEILKDPFTKRHFEEFCERFIPLEEIAAWCGCTDSAIIEKKAIKNIKSKLGEKCLRELMEEILENRGFSPGKNASVLFSLSL